MTAGFRSTEFWLSAVSSLFGALLCVLGFWRSEVLIVTGAALLAASTFAYAHSRGKAKTPRPYLPPSGKL